MLFYVCLPAPVSKPAVSQMCLSPEQMIVSCSSEGDVVKLILNLDGLLLMETRGHSQSLSSWTSNMQPLVVNKTEHNKPGVSDVTISLHGQPTGNLMCQVWNNVSRDETVIHLKSCKGTVLRGCFFRVASFCHFTYFCYIFQNAKAT